MYDECSIGIVVDKSKAVDNGVVLPPTPYYKPRERKVNIFVPANWFEAFKEEYFPTFLLKRWPVRYITNHSDPGIVYDPDSGECITRLNGTLAIIQGVTAEEFEAIKISHVFKDRLFKLAKKTDNKHALRMFANVFESLEFEQQKLWHFPADSTRHLFFTLPGCTCPKMDNRDRLGVSDRVFNENCPIHGLENPQKQTETT